MNSDDSGEVIYVRRGDDEAYDIAVKEFTYDAHGEIIVDDQGAPVLAAVNITGWKFMLTVKKFKNDPDSQALFPTIKVTNHVNAAQGISQIDIPSAATIDKPLGTYNFDVQRVDAQGKIKTMVVGQFVIGYDITKATS